MPANALVGCVVNASEVALGGVVVPLSQPIVTRTVAVTSREKRTAEADMVCVEDRSGMSPYYHVPKARRKQTFCRPWRSIVRSSAAWSHKRPMQIARIEWRSGLDAAAQARRGTQ